jgi:hypothetical protein
MHRYIYTTGCQTRELRVNLKYLKETMYRTSAILIAFCYALTFYRNTSWNPDKRRSVTDRPAFPEADSMRESKPARGLHSHLLSFKCFNLYREVKKKGKLSLCLIKHYAMKAYGGVDV